MTEKVVNNKITSQSTFDRLMRFLFLIGGIGFFVSFLCFLRDQHHFFYSYLFSFSFYLTLTLGAMFIVLIQHVTRSGWSVVVRRIPELLMNNISLLVFLFIPLLFGLGDLYHWMHPEAVTHDHLLQGKAPYLNGVFFVVRICIYFSLWAWISRSFFSGSILQDDTGDPDITLNLQKKSTYSLILFAFTLTFSFIDLVMSLTPHWYSTIFGVYIFAGSAVVSFSVTSLGYMFLRRQGLLIDIVTVEHYHDLGKLIYGFNIFWSYIAFCQFFLIWYANVPEETIFYAKHFVGTWNHAAALLAIGHFGIPFVLFMSRHTKRCLPFHAVMAFWMVLMHILDLYWIIMPTVSPLGISISLADFATFFAFTGLYFGFFLKSMRTVALIPQQDPRLSESLNFSNV